MVAMIVVVLTSAWIGAALLATAVVAPAAFDVLPTRTLAGALVGRVLPVLFITGILVGVATIVRSHKAIPIAGVGGVVMIASCLIAQFVISPRIERIRVAVGGPIDTLAITDPQRVDFGRLHGASVGLLGLAMIASAVALFVTIAPITKIRQ